MSSQIRLHSGILFDPLNPDVSVVMIEDIAYGLAGLYRFGGHTRLTVAQHCVHVSETGEGEELSKLMHDASEGLGLIDLPSPLKYGLFGDKYRAAEDRLMLPLSVKFGFTWPKTETVDLADKAILAAERRDLFGRMPRPDEPVTTLRIVPWSPVEAERRFLERFAELTGEVMMSCATVFSRLDIAYKPLPSSDDPNVFTTSAYAAHAQISTDSARCRLLKMLGRGIVERARVKQLRGDDRFPHAVTGWRFIGDRAVNGASAVPTANDEGKGEVHAHAHSEQSYKNGIEGGASRTIAAARTNGASVEHSADAAMAESAATSSGRSPRRSTLRGVQKRPAKRD